MSILGNVIPLSAGGGGGEPTVITSATTVSASSTATISDLKVNDLVICNHYGSTAPTASSNLYLLLTSLTARTTTYGNAKVYQVTADGTATLKNNGSYNMTYGVIRFA